MMFEGKPCETDVSVIGSAVNINKKFGLLTAIFTLFFFVMSSSFNNWSAHDIVGPINKREVCAALLDYEINKFCFRTWDTIETT